MMIQSAGDVGIIFLLFLLGLHLHPQNLMRMMKKVTGIGLVSSVAFAASSAVIAHCCGMDIMSSIIVGVAMMFSSTIIGLKLLPTTVLHHQHTGELMISVLLMQDIIAIVVLLFIQGAADTAVSWTAFAKVAVAFPVLLFVAYIFQRFILGRLLARFDRFQEYIFLLSIGWCLSMAEISHFMGLSEDVGAFIAGVAIATNPIAFFIAESLKPLRDFFLVIFFFSIGAGFDFGYLPEIFIPAILLTAGILFFKPYIYRALFVFSGETKEVSMEVGVRLAQASEFSILVAALAASTGLASAVSANLIQAATILTFIVSSYWVVMRYPTPVSMNQKLQRD
jgi:Kef-type K+ transport system membrane component KefB